jgi:hypothetical protein
MVKACVLFEVRTKLLNSIYKIFGFKGLILVSKLASQYMRWVITFRLPLRKYIFYPTFRSQRKNIGL